MKGTRERRVAAWAIKAQSWASWTELEASRAKPVCRQAMTSDWSPKIDRAWAATVRAATCMQKQFNSPAILYRLGIISSRPWDAVNVVARLPAWRAPWMAAMAPASDCISVTSGMLPQMLVLPLADHSSHHSPMGEEGVIG
jgi:hypothetical protein